MELTYLIEAVPNICMNLWVGMPERALVTPMYQHIWAFLNMRWATTSKSSR
jgi:hypothetical protein